MSHAILFFFAKINACESLYSFFFLRARVLATVTSPCLLSFLRIPPNSSEIFPPNSQPVLHYFGEPLEPGETVMDDTIRVLLIRGRDENNKNTNEKKDNYTISKKNIVL